MKDVKYTSQSIQALNKSLESGVLMCQLYNGELNKSIMNLTNQFCQRQLGQQPGSKVWENVQLKDDNEIIPNKKVRGERGRDTNHPVLCPMVNTRSLHLLQLCQ